MFVPYQLGPILGLLGTLIPLGPGLAALGSGDIVTLAEALTVAFDTTDWFGYRCTCLFWYLNLKNNGMNQI